MKTRTSSQKNKINHHLKKLLNLEGGYVDHPSDSGGKTNHGITERLARAHGYKGKMKALTQEKAIEIYDRAFIGPTWFVMILDHSEQIAFFILQDAINRGVSPTIKSLQRVLNVLNKQNSLYQDLKVDGIMGPVTLRAVEICLEHHTQAESVLLKNLEAQQMVHYQNLAANRKKDEDFMWGWTFRVLKSLKLKEEYDA